MQLKHFKASLARLALFTLSLFLAQTVLVHGQTPPTAFTYQGALQDAGLPANGTYRLAFRLFDAPSGGTQIGSMLSGEVAIVKGLFTVVLDFGLSPFASGAERYLEITVNEVALSPRQALTASPFALTALNVIDNSITAPKLNTASAPLSSQILGYDTGALRWVNDGLTLPYSAQIDHASNNTPLLAITNTGQGILAQFRIDQPTNSRPALLAVTRGLSQAGRFEIDNTANSLSAVRALTNGIGNAVYGTAQGAGRGGMFDNSSAQSVLPALEARTAGTGPAFLAAAGTGLAGDFVGTVRMISFQMTLGAQDEAVMVSDADGVGTWVIPVWLKPGDGAGGDLSGTYPAPVVAPNAITAPKLAMDSGSLAKVSGGAMAVSNGNVGIGTDSPASKLELSGGDLRLSSPGSGVVFSDGSKLSSASSEGMPSGFMILGETPAAPPGYSFTGLTLGETWQTAPPVPVPNYIPTATSYNNTVIVLGGYYNNQYFNYFFQSDSLTNLWTQKPSMLTNRLYHGAAVFRDKLYAIGGYNGNYLSSVEQFDFLTNQWQYVASLPVMLYAMSCAVVNQKIYVIGGVDSVGVTNRVWEYDPFLNVWTQKADMPTARHLLAAATVGGKIYAMGGVGSGGSTSRTMEIYDPTTNTWSTGPTMPRGKIHHSAVMVRGKIYVVCGTGDTEENGYIIDEFNPATNQWRTLSTTMLTPRRIGAAAVSNNKIFTIGGMDEATGSIVRTVEVFDPALFYVHRKD